MKIAQNYRFEAFFSPKITVFGRKSRLSIDFGPFFGQFLVSFRPKIALKNILLAFYSRKKHRNGQKNRIMKSGSIRKSPIF